MNFMFIFGFIFLLIPIVSVYVVLECLKSIPKYVCPKGANF